MRQTEHWSQSVASHNMQEKNYNQCHDELLGFDDNVEDRYQVLTQQRPRTLGSHNSFRHIGRDASPRESANVSCGNRSANHVVQTLVEVHMRAATGRLIEYTEHALPTHGTFEARIVAQVCRRPHTILGIDVACYTCTRPRRETER